MKKDFVLFATFIFLISSLGMMGSATPYTGSEHYPTYILFYLQKHGEKASLFKAGMNR